MLPRVFDRHRTEFRLALFRSLLPISNVTSQSLSSYPTLDFPDQSSVFRLFATYAHHSPGSNTETGTSRLHPYLGSLDRTPSPWHPVHLIVAISGSVSRCGERGRSVPQQIFSPRARESIPVSLILWVCFKGLLIFNIPVDMILPHVPVSSCQRMSGVCPF